MRALRGQRITTFFLLSTIVDIAHTHLWDVVVKKNVAKQTGEPNL